MRSRIFNGLSRFAREFFTKNSLRITLLVVALFGLLSNVCRAEGSGGSDTVWRAICLSDYNTRVVFFGTAILGACSGVVGTHLFLRRRALLGDVISHASLPGVCLAFLIGEAFYPGGGKSLSGLMVGASASALCGVICLEGIRRTKRLAEDAALAIVLSLFFGFGTALLTVIQSLPTGSAAGLADFLFGKPAGLLIGDVILISISSAIVLLICGLLWKELVVVSFDLSFAQSQGWPIRSLDFLLVCLVTAITVIGMQCVGLLLMVSLLIIPPAAARFWTNRISSLALISGGIGALSAACGVILSAAFPRLAAGAVIVLCATAFFLVSIFVGSQRGMLGRWWMQRMAVQKAGRHDLLRACFELVEQRTASQQPAASLADWTSLAWSYADLSAMRKWSRGRLPKIWNAALKEGLIRSDAEGLFHLTTDGVREAQAAARKHRLWELYLIRFADRHPIDVDRDADVAEHILDPLILEELEALLLAEEPSRQIPLSPHAMSATPTSSEGASE